MGEIEREKRGRKYSLTLIQAKVTNETIEICHFLQDGKFLGSSESLY